MVGPLIDLSRLMSACLEAAGVVQADDLLVVRMGLRQYPGQARLLRIFLWERAVRRIYAAVPDLMGCGSELLPTAYDLLVSEIAPLAVEQQVIEALLDPDEVSQECAHELLQDTPRAAATRALLAALLRTCSVVIAIEGN